MSIITTALDVYIEDRDFPLVGALQFKPTMTASMATVQTNIKSSSKLHYMATTVTFADASNCTRTVGDTTTFTDKTITVGTLSANENLCLQELEGKWTQILMQQGSLQGKQSLPSEIAEIYLMEKADIMSQELEKADWMGDTLSGTNNLSYYDGWVKYIDAGSAVNGNTGAVTAATGITRANVLALLQDMYLARPENLRQRGDIKLFVGQDVLDLYNMALIDANLYQWNGNSDESNQKLFGTNVEIVGTYGLNASNRMFITYPTNLVIGVDGEGDKEFSTRLDPVSEKVIFLDNEFKRGTQVQFVEDCVEFTLVP